MKNGYPILNNRDRYHNFGILRVIVACAVLVGNATYVDGGLLVINVLKTADLALLGAKVGVELLIMLSGFLLMRDLLQANADPLRVLARRLIGLVPLLIVTALVSAALYPETYVRALLTFSYNFETASLISRPLQPWWTVFVILHLIVIWCVLAKSGVTAKGFSRLSVGWVVVATLVGIGLNISDPACWMEWNYKSTITRGVGWSVGVLVAIHGVPRLPALSGRIAVGTWALACLLYVAVNNMGPGAAPWQLIQSLITFTAFVILINCIQKIGNQSAFWHTLSGYTFSLYIVQGPVIWWFAQGASRVENFTVYANMLLCCIAAAVIAEHSIVRPCCKFKPGTKKARKGVGLWEFLKP